jgi:isopenicillin N synthase-like dioxygenase
MSALDSLPVLDVSGFLADPEGRAGRRFVAELRAACHEVGFAHLIGHGIESSLDDAVHAVSRRFFDLPLEQRLEIVNTNSPHFRGYTRLGMEHTGGKPDWRDQIDIGPERPTPDVGDDAPVWLRLRGPNQWPSHVPEMRDVIVTWMDRMAVVGLAVLRALAVGLGQSLHHFDDAVSPDPEVLVKIIRYPALQRDGSSEHGVGAHHDSGLLTFIHQDDVGGLQVWRGDRFVDVPRLPGAYVLNLGEMLQLATNGYLRATRHRVVSPPSGVERLSVAYFFNPCMEASFDPVVLPDALSAEAVGGQNTNPDDPVFSTYGENWLKFRLRSHPDVAAIHHKDLIEVQ